MGFAFINWPNWFLGGTSKYGRGVFFNQHECFYQDNHKLSNVLVDLLPTSVLSFRVSVDSSPSIVAPFKLGDAKAKVVNSHKSTKVWV